MIVRKKHVSLIVRDNNLTREEVASSMYWTEVAYKELYNNRLNTKGAYNERIENPLNVEEFAGFIKLRGWAYEREIRLTSVVEKQLKENERVAIRLPQDFRKNIQIVTVPGFDKTKYKNKISRLKRIGVDIKSSEYDEMVDLMGSVDDAIKKRISEVELENNVLRKHIQNKSDIKDIESIIEIKNTLENELVDNKRVNKYRTWHIKEYEPWRKFSFNNIILRAISVYNPTYNKGLIKRELYDFFDDGILVFSTICSKKIIISNGVNEEVETMEKDVYVVDAVPFYRIYKLDINGSKNYPYPTLYCRFENGNPFVEEWYIDKQTGFVYEKHLI